MAMSAYWPVRVLVSVLAAPVMFGVLGSSAARAEFPDRPITLIVGFSAGGGTDLVARGMQRAFEAALGTQVIVKNVPGAGATIATAEMATAAADGYTLHLASNALVIQPHRMKLTYDVKALTPVCLVTETPLFVVTPKTSKYKTLADVIAAARAEPGKIPYGSPGAGTSLHLGMAAFEATLGLKMKHVPFKGASEVNQAMLSGTLDIAASLPNLVEQYDLNALAALSDKRIAGFETIPTVKELTGIEVTTFLWMGILAPPETPKPALAKLDQACKTSLADKDTIDYFAKQKQPVTYLGTEPFRKYVVDELERTRQAMEAAGLVQK